MKKIFFLILLISIFLVSCQTKESLNKEKEQKRIDDIKEEVSKSDIPSSVKEWLITNKTKTTVTILCIKTSKRCLSIEKIINELKNNNIYFIYLDDISDELSNIYKTTYDLKDYTGYLPYMFIVSNDSIIKTETNITSKNIKEILYQNKIISEN